MCVSVTIDGELLLQPSIGELRKVMPEIVIDESAPMGQTDDFCCCWVDFQKTADANGYTYNVVDGDFVLTKEAGNETV